MESVLQDVEIAIDNWLEEISSKEIQIQKLMLLQEKKVILMFLNK